MSGDATPILGLMASAIAAQFGFIIWLYRWTISRADERIKSLETRQDQTLQTLAEAIRPIPAMMQSMVEALKELRITLSYQRSGEQRPDRREG